MNHHKILLLLTPFLFTTFLTAGKDPKQPATPGAPRTVRLNDQEQRNRIEDQNNLLGGNPAHAPHQRRLNRHERQNRINSMLVVLKPGSRSPSPNRS